MPASSVVSRVDIETWADDSRELYLFRRAMEEMQEISDQSLMDERGYQWCAGVHGGFGGAAFCEHGTPEFLVWHRPYLLDFELKLRDQIARIASVEEANQWRLPYWKWDSPDVTGLPKAFTDQTYDDDGTTKPNPLFSQPYQLTLNPFLPGNPVPWPTDTFRTPGSLASLQNLRPRVETAMNAQIYTRFNSFLEGPHGSVHMWVGGYMTTFRSSFDPIFWLHHCNIDRQWWEWQQKNTDASVPQGVRQFECQPFRFDDISAEAFFDTREHGYTYAASREMTRASDFADAKVVTAKDKTDRQILYYTAAKIQQPADQVLLHIHELEYTEETYELRFFANRSSYPKPSTSLTERSGYLGSYVILGHGACPGAPGHCDRNRDELTADHRKDHHLTPFDVSIDITDGVKKIERARSKKAKRAMGAGAINLYMLVLDSEGKKVRHTLIEFDNISITTHQDTV